MIQSLREKSNASASVSHPEDNRPSTMIETKDYNTEGENYWNADSEELTSPPHILMCTWH
jgi:hypothetical protein